MVTIFSFGYHGWGTQTRRLINLVDDSEKESGFRPPLWVDARDNRSVRAPGFRDHEYRKALGHDRYEWMQGLGNKNVSNDRPAELNDPSAIGMLLDRALEESSEKRRVIFFCSCQLPDWKGASCHRFRLISPLLVRHAKKLGKKISVIEWPGGNPRTIRIGGNSRILALLKAERSSLPMRALRVAVPRNLPYGSIVEFQFPDQTVPILTGLAFFRKEWLLPWYEIPFRPNLSKSYLQKKSSQLRKRNHLQGFAS